MSNKKKGLINKLFGFETIKNGASMTRSMLKDIKPNKKNYIKETFSQAMKRAGIPKANENEHLLKIYKNYKIQFLMILIGVLFLLFNGIKILFIKEYSLTNLLSGISFLTIGFALTTMGMHFSFRTFQIRKKRLGMLGYWLKNPKEWYPKKINQDYLKNIDSFQEENKKHNELDDINYINSIKEFNK